MIDRRGFLAAMAAGATARAQSDPPPNILLVLFDKCRTDAWSCYDERPGAATPHIDTLAKQGTRFSNAFTPAALCGPARASMLTGKYPHAHGLQRNVYSAPRGKVNTNYPEPIADPFRDGRFRLWDNFPFLLNNAGYATGCVGKWHLGPGNPGFFDTFKGFNSLLRHWVGEPHKSRYRPDIHTDEGIRFIESNADRPWFLYQSYYAPHEPLDPPKEFAARFAGQENADYYATVAHLDHCVGRLTDTLRRRNLLDNTLVIVTTDHGRTWIDRPGAAEGISLSYEEVARIPMVIRYPELFPAGKVWSSGVTTADLMPTALEAANVSAALGPPAFGLSPAIQATSLAERLRGPDRWQSAVIMQNIPQRGIDGSYYEERAVRTARHKLIVRKFEVRPELRDGELYDLETDRGESRNLYAAQPALVRDLAGQLAAWGRTNGDALAVELGDWARR
ncbi:MAG: sulfatase-like hydrolase/transferase [Bryobacteraceae bacterium]